MILLLISSILCTNYKVKSNQQVLLSLDLEFKNNRERVTSQQIMVNANDLLTIKVQLQSIPKETIDHLDIQLGSLHIGLIPNATKKDFHAEVSGNTLASYLGEEIILNVYSKQLPSYFKSISIKEKLMKAEPFGETSSQKVPETLFAPIVDDTKPSQLELASWVIYFLPSQKKTSLLWELQEDGWLIRLNPNSPNQNDSIKASASIMNRYFYGSLSHDILLEPPSRLQVKMYWFLIIWSPFFFGLFKKRRFANHAQLTQIKKVNKKQKKKESQDLKASLIQKLLYPFKPETTQCLGLKCLAGPNKKLYIHKISLKQNFGQNIKISPITSTDWIPLINNQTLTIDSGQNTYLLKYTTQGSGK